MKDSRPLSPRHRATVLMPLLGVVLLLLFVLGMRSGWPAAEATTLSRQDATSRARRMPRVSSQPWRPVDTSPPGRRSVFVDPRVPQAPPAPALKFDVQADGLYVVTYEDVVRVPGFDKQVDPRTFHLIRRGTSVPILVEGEEDGRFDPGDRILFFGEKRHGSAMFTKYSDKEVYWLTWGNAPGPRVIHEAAPPIQGARSITTTRQTVRVEQDMQWFTHHGLDFPTRQTWWWARAQPYGAPVTVTFPLTIPAPLPGTAARLTYEMAPRTRVGPHRVRVGMNGHPLASHQFTAHTYRVFTDTVPAGIILSSPISVTLMVEPIPDLQLEDLYVDGFTLTYTRTLQAVQGWMDVHVRLQDAANVQIGGVPDAKVYVWETGDPVRRLEPVRDATSALLTLGLPPGEHHLLVATEGALRHPDVKPYVPAALRSVEDGADLIIITHKQLWEAAEQLATYRREQGYRVQVVDVDALYDEFGWGWYHPEAIRAFLAYAYAHWPRPAPRYVLLLGDGHWNFKKRNTDRYGPLPPNLVPPYLAWVDPYQGEVPVDIAYGMVAGNDDIPEMIVGRISVPDLNTARAVVAKIISYEQGRWLMSEGADALVFVADNPDQAGNFPALVRQLMAGNVPSWAQVERIFLGETYADKEGARAALLSALNRGAWLVLFQGHGAVTRWTHESLLSAQDIPDLNNHTIWPLVATFNCLDGYFAYPRTDYDAIAERMLRREGAGSIAAWSPAGLGTPWIQVSLARAFLGALFTERSGILGDVVHRARLQFYEDIGPNEIFFTQTLHGDPLLHLMRPQSPPVWYLPRLLHSSP